METVVFSEKMAFTEQMANKIIDMGLTMPAILLLEAHKPLAFIGSQLLLVAQPTLDIFLPHNIIRNTADLLANPDQLEQLIAKLEMNATSPSTDAISIKSGEDVCD